MQLDYDLEDAKLIQTGFMKVWEIFMHFFTWFFGASLLTMSWVVTGTHVHGGPLVALGLTWLAGAVLGMLACYLVGKYTRLTQARLRELFESHNRLRDSSVSLVTGFIVTNYAWKATGIALAMTVPAWIFLMCFFFKG